jgi:hypothetical protein
MAKEAVSQAGKAKKKKEVIKAGDIAQAGKAEPRKTAPKQNVDLGDEQIKTFPARAAAHTAFNTEDVPNVRSDPRLRPLVKKEEKSTPVYPPGVKMNKPKGNLPNGIVTGQKKEEPKAKKEASAPKTEKTPVEIVRNPFYKETDKFSSAGSYGEIGGKAKTAKKEEPKAKKADPTPKDPNDGVGPKRVVPKPKAKPDRRTFQLRPDVKAADAPPKPTAKPLKDIKSKPSSPKPKAKPKVVVKKSATGKGVVKKTFVGNWVGAAPSRKPQTLQEAARRNQSDEYMKNRMRPKKSLFGSLLKRKSK